MPSDVLLECLQAGNPEMSMSRTRILICGEALIEEMMDESGSVVSTKPGGGPFNVACCLGRMGVDVSFLGAISEQDSGEEQMQALETASVHTDMVQRSSLPSGKATIRPNPNGHKGFDYEFHLAGTSESSFSTSKISPKALRKFDLLHVGSLACYTEPMAYEVASLARALSKSCVITFDPNVRLASDSSRKEALSRIESLVRHVSVVRCSEADVRALYPNISSEVVARRWVESGPPIAIVTRGNLGAYLLRPGQKTMEINAFQSDCVDSRGMGDAFFAGFICRLMEASRLTQSDLAKIPADELEGKILFAAANASLSSGRIGTYAPTQSEIEALMVSQGAL